MMVRACLGDIKIHPNAIISPATTNAYGQVVRFARVLCPACGITRPVTTSGIMRAHRKDAK